MIMAPVVGYFFPIHTPERGVLLRKINSGIIDNIKKRDSRSMEVRTRWAYYLPATANHKFWQLILHNNERSKWPLKDLLSQMSNARSAQISHPEKMAAGRSRWNFFRQCLAKSFSTPKDASFTSPTAPGQRCATQCRIKTLNGLGKPFGTPANTIEPFG